MRDDAAARVGQGLGRAFGGRPFKDAVRRVGPLAQPRLTGAGPAAVDRRWPRRRSRPTTTPLAHARAARHSPTATTEKRLRTSTSDAAAPRRPRRGGRNECLASPCA